MRIFAAWLRGRAAPSSFDVRCLERRPPMMNDVGAGVGGGRGAGFKG